MAQHSDLLLHDAQHSTLQYQRKKGWGHSSMDDAIRFAANTGTKRLLLARHDPSHSDEQLNEYNRDLKTNHDQVFAFELTAEGMNIDLP